MFGLSELKQTRVYQEAEEEGKQKGRFEAKLEAVPKLLALCLSMEQPTSRFVSRYLNYKYQLKTPYFEVQQWYNKSHQKPQSKSSTQKVTDSQWRIIQNNLHGLSKLKKI